MNRVLTSGHLSLRPIEAAEAARLHELWTDEHVRRFLWDGNVIPLAQTQEIVERSSRLFDERGFGLWGVHEGEAPGLVGFAGYWYFRTPPSLELIYGVDSRHWNRGVATAASRNVIGYGFDVLDFTAIEASTDVGNTASVRVLEKLGMTFRQRAVVDGLDTVFYELRRDDWRRPSER